MVCKGQNVSNSLGADLSRPDHWDAYPAHQQLRPFQDQFDRGGIKLSRLNKTRVARGGINFWGGGALRCC